MSTNPNPNRPTGHLRTTPEGRELVIERSFRAPIDDVWASLTEPERFARWYGPMVGEPGPGKTVTVTMAAEKEIVAEPARIIECDPPTSFVVELGDRDPPWHLSANLAEADGTTNMTFVHTLPTMPRSLTSALGGSTTPTASPHPGTAPRCPTGTPTATRLRSLLTTAPSSGPGGTAFRAPEQARC
ncbi:MAG: SRPBCC domain-containing protein [Acidimicrobiales bacterium]